MKPFTRRKPTKCRPTAWGRVLQMDGQLVAYRLFRRGLSGKVHTRQLQYLVDVAPRSMIAADLIKARRELRDRVDEIDYAAMEEAA